ncbi:hypothetical protein BH10BAC3_BH10BAC3_13080 [soil metagenome]
MKKVFALIIITIIFFGWLSSCKHEIFNPGGVDSTPDSTGTGADGKICFETDVLPIFQLSCAKSGCHDAITNEAGYMLDSYENIIKKDIKPGKASDSKIYKVLFESGENAMPKDAPPLTTLQKNRIAQWINEGANNTKNCSTSVCDTTQFKFAANVAPILNNYCTSCHNTAGAAANGGVDLSKYAAVINHVDQIPGAIQWLPGSKQMPQGGSKLSDCNIKIILKWINAGAQNN